MASATETSKKPLILWGAGTSRTIRPHWAMQELGLTYQSRPILPRTGETLTAEYTALNPRQKIPLLQDDDFTIGESAAIVAYLSRTYSTPDCALVPEERRQYAAWLEWCFFIVAELDSTSLYVMRRHTDLKHIYGDAPEVVAEAAKYFRGQLRHVETALTWAIDYGVGICDNAYPYLERTTARAGYQRGKTANTPPPGSPPVRPPRPAAAP